MIIKEIGDAKYLLNKINKNCMLITVNLNENRQRVLSGIEPKMLLKVSGNTNAEKEYPYHYFCSLDGDRIDMPVLRLSALKYVLMNKDHVNDMGMLIDPTTKDFSDVSPFVTGTYVKDLKYKE